MYQQVPDDEGGRNRAQELQENIKDPVELKIVQVGRGTRQIVASLSWTLANLKEAFFDAEVKQGKNIRIISQGKLLQDDSTLEAVGLRDGAFLHVSICERNNGMVNNPADERHAASQSQFTLDHEEQIPQWLVQVVDAQRRRTKNKELAGGEAALPLNNLENTVPRAPRTKITTPSA